MRRMFPWPASGIPKEVLSKGAYCILSTQDIPTVVDASETEIHFEYGVRHEELRKLGPFQIGIHSFMLHSVQMTPEILDCFDVIIREQWRAGPRMNYRMIRDFVASEIRGKNGLSAGQS